MTGVERLRELAREQEERSWSAVTKVRARIMREIADQIEREHAEDCLRMGGRAVEDAEAVAWVREHGGLDAMVELSSRLMTVDALRAAIEETCTRIGVEHTGDLTQDAQAIWREIGALRSRLKESVPRAAYERHLARRQRQIDESHAALRRRNARIGFLVSELNRANHENHEEFMRRAGDFTAFTDEVCNRLAPELRYVEGCSKDVMDAALEALDRRLMPEGGWPRFEDGEMVFVGSDFADGLGETHTVTSVEFFDGCVELHWNPDEPGEFEYLHPGERVRRPVRMALDADGVETCEGDTVYLLPGEWCDKYPLCGCAAGCEMEVLRTHDVDHDVKGVIKCLNKTPGVRYPICYPQPSQLTHERPESKCRDCAHWQKDPTADNMGVCWFLYHEYEGQDCYAARRGDIGACEEFMPRAKALAERGR